MFLNFYCQRVLLMESAKLSVLCTPSRLLSLPIIDTRITHLHVCTPTRLTCLCAFTLASKCHACSFFVLCCVVSIVRYDLRPQNPRKDAVPYFISLKVIKFTSNVFNFQLYSIIIHYLFIFIYLSIYLFNYLFVYLFQFVYR